MIFTTYQFLVFFIAIFVLFFMVPHTWRHPLLLVASYYFYMCSIPCYIIVIIVITIIDFWAGIKIEDAVSHYLKRLYLVLSILSNFGLLFIFKYAGFFEQTILNDALGFDIPTLRFILPLGISFHTFQAVSYTVEVYRGKSPAERNLLIYSLYVAFFPQMVAGPIERPYNLLPQFHSEQVLTLDRFRSGLRMALWGVFKKVAVADLLAPAVNSVYLKPHQFTGPMLMLATFFFSIQIYCDFSGYSDIAVGLARIMGYDLMINFRYPYFAKSIGEFWRHWHISLSTWFRDYIYIPIGGSRVPKLHYFFNVMVVFLMSGLWHGANWTFAIWGLLHCLYLIFGQVTASVRKSIRSILRVDGLEKLLSVLQVLTTFFLVTVAWVFFRANTLQDALYILTHFTNIRGFRVNDLFSVGLPRFEVALSFAMIAVTAITEWCIATHPCRIIQLWTVRPFRWAMTYACVFATIFFGVFGHVEFIYFQF